MEDSLELPAAAKRKRQRDNHDVSSSAGSVPLESLVDPDFEELASQFPDFRRAWRALESKRATQGGSLASHMTQDFSIALSRALLSVHFGIHWTAVLEAHNHLCPPIPNRFFYVQWVQQHILPATHQHFDSPRPLVHRGLDIGTGAFCIYPLLFAASSSKYRVHATDVDPASLATAEKNVRSNPSLQERIRINLVPPTDSQQHANQSATGQSSAPVGPLLRSLERVQADGVLEVDFCMTNPPFFDDRVGAELTEPRQGDQRDRAAMTENEGGYPGGEVAFVVEMIVDGLVLFARQGQGSLVPPRWSSCMCGKKTSFTYLKGLLVSLLGPGHVLSTEFGPGHMTRWFLAWTFERPLAHSPLAKYWSSSFIVTVASKEDVSEESLLVEIGKRLREYCETFPRVQLEADTMLLRAAGRPELTVRLREKTPKESALLPNELEKLPFSVGVAVAQMPSARRREVLPIEGHFLFLLTGTKAGPKQTQVAVEAFQHSAYGKMIVDKIKGQLEGELCRTNRRWRRKQKQQQEQNHEMDST